MSRLKSPFQTPLPSSMDHRGIAALFRTGTTAEQVAFIQGCPDFPFKEQAVSLAQSSSPGTTELALSMVAMALAYGRAPVLGAEISLAAHTLLREALDRLGPDVILRTTVSDAAANAVNALNMSGRHEDVVTFVNSVESLYESDRENGPSIRIARITALYELGQIDEVRKYMEAERRRGVSGPARVEFDRIDARMQCIVREVRELAIKQPTTTSSAGLAATHGWVSGLVDRLTSILSGNSREMNLWQIMKMNRDAMAIFTDPKKDRDPEHLRSSLVTLTAVRRWSQAHDAKSEENDALWGTYLCQSRLGFPAAAAAALQDLRRNVEQARSSIKDPMKRAGFSKTYPHLFEALCKMLNDAGKPAELLDAIEGAKGRAVADLLVEKLGKAVDERQMLEPVALLPSLMKRLRAHYLSFFVDEDATYAVLVAKDGSVHAAPEVPIGRAAVKALAAQIGSANNRQRIDDVLAPLLEWLGDAMDDGLIADGDHLCYAPDEHLHHVPLQGVTVRGQPLVSWLSLSRTHGARALAMSLRRAPTKPSGYVVVEVPSRQNLEAFFDAPDFLRALRMPRDWLHTHLDGTALERLEATPAALRKLDLRNKVVHFAAHGTFFSESPYSKSGVLLAGSNGLPDDTAGELPEGTLTPQRLLEDSFDVSGSHVTLQACVTGLAEEGIGGDALGLDWALSQAGASSLLVSHWAVAVDLSSDFCVTFYKNWLTDGHARGAAWRETVDAFIRADGAHADLDAWSAFSLSGDWR